MRNTFANTFLELAKSDKRLILLTGDLGFSVFEPLIEACPNQYINCGMIEQSMTGIAAGLASEGYLPVIYSIIPFITIRNIEQIRNDICYQNLPVTVVGVGAGFSYGPYGHTHHALEDIGMLRTIPNLRILAPGDPHEVKALTKQLFKHPQPTYLRIGKKGEPILHSPNQTVSIGKAITMSEGRDVTIIATSTMLETGHLVRQQLLTTDIHVQLISMHTIKPLDSEAIKKAAAKTPLLVTLEEHSIIGGLGSAVLETLADNAIQIPVLRFGIPDRFTKTIGPQEYMREVNHLSVNSICNAIKNRIEVLQKKH